MQWQIVTVLGSIFAVYRIFLQKQPPVILIQKLHNSLNENNIEKILSDTSSWLAHSSSVIKNCKIKRVYAKRDKRYFDKSKLSLLKLIEHSIRVNAVFAKRVVISSVFYITFIYLIFGLKNLTFLIFVGIIFFNLLIFLIRIKHSIKNYKICDNIIESIKSF